MSSFREKRKRKFFIDKIVNLFREEKCVVKIKKERKTTHMYRILDKDNILMPK